MLIDCGTLGATTTKVDINDVIKDITKTTNNHIHLLVATHEHQDHLSGFPLFKNDSDPLKVDNVWVAWTEDPKDTLAQQLVKYKGDLEMALMPIAQALTDAGGISQESEKMGKIVHSILEFGGDPNALKAYAETVNDKMNFVRTGLGTQQPGFQPNYLSPGGEAREPAWLPGFRFYVLGPPRSKDALSNTGEQGSPELYSLAAAITPGAMDDGTGEQKHPFDIRFRLRFDNHFGSCDQLSVPPALHEYFDKNESWRRVDFDWLHGATDLALQLDSLTNNTCLALAIERIGDGKVLLFPGDAQLGNWLSWHDDTMKWTVRQDQETREVTAADLLNRTVFYKAGHHSSHNATARGKGLELMQRENELIAFIPVDRAVALKRNPQGSWKMPARPLYLRLLQKCQGRVVRSDLGWADDAKKAKYVEVEEEFHDIADPTQWAKWKASQNSASDRVTINDRYVDFMLR